MALGMEVGFGPGLIVLDGDPAPLPKKGAEPPIFGPSLLWPNGCIDQDATWYGCIGLGLRDIVYDVDPATPRKKRTPTPTQFWPMSCGQTAGWMKTPLGTEVDLGLGYTVLDGVPAPEKGAQHPPLFGLCLLWPSSPISATAELLLNKWPS